MNQPPPHNIEAEESILSECLAFPDTAPEVCTILKPDDFYKTVHQKIFTVIADEVELGEKIDVATILAKLKNTNGIGSTLSEIIDAPVTINTEKCCKLILDTATARKTIMLCYNTIKKIHENGIPIIETLNTFQNDALSLGVETKESFTTMAELTNQSVDRYEKLKEQKVTPGIKTGYYYLDALTGGFRGSKLIIVAARPAIGKTAFMCNLVENMARARRKCGVFELEMDKEELDDRWFSSMTGISTTRLSTPPIRKEHEISPNDWEMLIDAAGMKAEWPIVIDDSGGLTVPELKRRARKMKQWGVEIIFIDQLSEIKGNSRKSLFESNTEIVEELGRLKKELRLPIVLLAQLNRQLENRDDKEPRLSDLKNTGMLEEKADMVLLGYRKYVYTEKPEDENHAQWHLAKHRGGPVRKIEMVWQPKMAKFFNLKAD